MLICKFNDLENEYQVDFSQSGHVVTLHSTSGKLPEDTSGFFLSREGFSDRWDYSAFNTIYYKIDNFTYQYSDDGSQYEVPKIDVTVQAFWNDQDNIMGIRPESITVEFLNNGKKSFDDVLNEKNNFTIVHKDRLSNRKFTINAPDVAPYQKTVNGTTVAYYLDLPSPRIITSDDLAECIIAQSLGEQSPNLLNIYASYCETNAKNFYKDVPEDLQHPVMEIISGDGFMVNEDGTTSYKPINHIPDVDIKE